MEVDELRSRSMLHVNKLPAFTAWLIGKGWAQQETKGPYEVLRMSRKGKYGNKTLIVHKKLEAEVHCTTWGESQVWLLKWFKERKEEAGDE
jgi:hypothetical protein